MIVTEGQRAEFNCDALTTDSVLPLAQHTHLTVAILVHAPPSPGPMQCFNCSFNREELVSCRQEDEGCWGLQVSNSSSGLVVFNHRLTAVWSKADRNLSGSEVVCAIAVRGITQWAHTATLTVLPASPGPLPGPRSPRLLVWGGVAGGMVVVVLCGGVFLLGLALWFRRKHQTTPLQLDQCMLCDLWGGDLGVYVLLSAQFH